MSLGETILGSIDPPAPGAETDAIHRIIDNSFPPIATVPSGVQVTFDCPGLPFPREATLLDLEAFDSSHPHTIVGPVAIEGAEPGDLLVVDVLEVALPRDYGHTIFVPGFGLLPDDFTEPHVHNFDFRDGGRYAELRPGVRIPLNPFCGILGVAPSAPGEHPTQPPYRFGGNMDVRHLVAGSTLLLPVEVEGAMFYCGDGHAAQGDGEVCVTGLEAAVRATFKFSVLKERSIPAPQFITRSPLSIDAGDAGYFATTAPAADLYESSQEAIRAMIGYLVEERGLTRAEAYVLCSLVVDLKISEIVDIPRWIVSAYLPLSVFVAL